jgi:dissimilatory sulfite reductase (desulfoviridin) alpha/beta subunit
MRKKNHFSVRAKVTGGNLTSGELRALADAADKFGAGKVHLTSRQGAEVPFVKYEDLEPLKKLFAKKGLSLATGGYCVRSVTACQGSKVCPWGCIDASGLAGDIAKKHCSRKLPCKLKIGVTGCHNNCLKAEQNDLGVKGAFFAEIDYKKCKNCFLCVKGCREGALNLIKGEGMEIDRAKCINCGRCAAMCPAKAWSGSPGYRLYLGGTFGNRIAIGEQAIPILKDKREVLRAVDSVLDYFQANGKTGERLRGLLDRVGWDGIKKAISDGPAKPKRKASGAGAEN